MAEGLSMNFTHFMFFRVCREYGLQLTCADVYNAVLGDLDTANSNLLYAQQNKLEHFHFFGFKRDLAISISLTQVMCRWGCYLMF